MMLRIALAAIMVASITGVVALTGILPTSAQATVPSATRSINPAMVAPGGTVTVTIQAADYGQAGGVTETLPPGFAYLSSSLSASQVNESGRMSGSPSRGTTPSPTPSPPPGRPAPIASPALSGTSSVTTTPWTAIPASRWRLPVHQVHQLPAPRGASTRRWWPPAEL